MVWDADEERLASILTCKHKYLGVSKTRGTIANIYGALAMAWLLAVIALEYCSGPVDEGLHSGHLMGAETETERQ